MIFECVSADKVFLDTPVDRIFKPMGVEVTIIEYW